MDADIIRYQIGSVTCEHPYVKGVRIPAPLSLIHKLVSAIVYRTLNVTNADEFKMLFTGKNNFRIDLATEEPYKGHRVIEKPYHWWSVHEYILDTYGRRVVTCDGFEADDYMAFHRERDEPDIVYTICTRDKDLDTVPGWHYRWACGEKQPEVLPYYIDTFNANSFFLYQCLIGDGTDNIMGCGRRELVMWGGMEMRRRKGIGPKKALSMLIEFNTIGGRVDLVHAAYKERFPNEDWEAILLENARLLYMGQRKDKLFEWSWLDPILELKDEEDEDQSE